MCVFFVFSLYLLLLVKYPYRPRVSLVWWVFLRNCPPRRRRVGAQRNTRGLCRREGRRAGRKGPLFSRRLRPRPPTQRRNGRAVSD